MKVTGEDKAGEIRAGRNGAGGGKRKTSGEWEARRKRARCCKKRRMKLTEKADSLRIKMV